MAIVIETVDTTTAPESLLREMHEHYVIHDAERHPGDPPMPWDQRLGLWRNVLDHLDVRRWLLRDDGQIVAVAVAALERQENQHIAFARIHVRPERRREGLATRLAGPVLEALKEDDREVVVTDTAEDAPWESVLERLGMKKSYMANQSRLLVEDIDWDLMNRWVDRAAQRATDYELQYLTFPLEDALLEKWCGVMELMNTAPRESLAFDDFSMTPEKWRDIEAKDLAQGNHLAAYVAVHRPTGDWVGLSELLYQEGHPEQGQQGETAVDPVHRNKGLGRWLKAAMLERYIQDHPDVVRIDTENARSNEPMLNINYEMGYKPLRQEAAWQGDRHTIQERLGFR